MTKNVHIFLLNFGIMQCAKVSVFNTHPYDVIILVSALCCTTGKSFMYLFLFYTLTEFYNGISVTKADSLPYHYELFNTESGTNPCL